MQVGVLSDTHGLLRPEVLARLGGVERLLHAGDVGDGALLDRLGELAPVTAVAGNVDEGSTEAPLAALPALVRGSLGELAFLMVHRREDALAELDRLGAAGEPPPAVAVYGHSHRPELEWRGRTLLLNPGACGRRRFRLPLTVARLTVADGRLVPEILSVE